MGSCWLASMHSGSSRAFLHRTTAAPHTWPCCRKFGMQAILSMLLAYPVRQAAHARHLAA